ncbi:MAG: ABC transporter permease [Acidimicrobiia bacterium]|nr:ABC transporter permease [Acidimicrobiia bacterium]
MTTVDPAQLARESHKHVGDVARDALTMTWRNLLRLTRNPELMVFSTVQPIIFVLMFRYVFGGAITIPDYPYVDFLMAGVWVQSVTFGALNTGVGLAEDLQAGLIERFRSLPMARSAVLVGRTTADLVRNFFVVAVMTTVGFMVGFNYHTSALALLGALGIVLLFSYALSWLSALLGLMAPNAETAQAAFFPIVAVLVFASAAFVPVQTMPGWLQAFAKNQPVTAVIDAVRALTLGGPTAGKVVSALVWIAGIVAVFAPLSIRRYRKVA